MTYTDTMLRCPPCAECNISFIRLLTKIFYVYGGFMFQRVDAHDQRSFKKFVRSVYRSDKHAQ